MNHHRHGGVAGPLILIAIGAAFLLANMGLLTWSAWGLFRLWPLILVAIGIDLLVGRRSTPGAILAAVLIAGLFAGGLWLASTGYQAPLSSASTNVQQSLRGATRGSITLQPAAGELRLSALAGPSADLISGQALGQATGDVQQGFRESGGTAAFRMETTGPSVFTPTVGPGPTWSLMLNPDVPIDLEIEQGVGEMTLDLSLIKLSSLNVNLGVGQVTVRLPAEGQYQADIDSAIGNTIIYLPAGLEAKITLNAALAGRSLPDGFSSQGNAYISSGYATAANRVDLVLGQAIGNISVRRSAP
jgi:hypothetical protein